MTVAPIALGSRGLRSWQTPNCGPACRQARMVPVGGTRPILVDIHDASFHEGVAFARGHALGTAEGQASGAAWTLLTLTPRLRPDTQIIRTGPLLIDLWARLAAINGQPVPLTPCEFDILSYLGQRLGRPCSRGEIAAAVWPAGVERRRWRKARLDPNRPEHSLSTHFTRLRVKLGVFAFLLETHYGNGYLLVSDQQGGRP